MRRRQRDKAHAALMSTTPDVIAMTIREMVTLIGIFDHASAQISELSDTDRETIANASGSTLIPSLYGRAGLASIRGRHSIPFLADEVGLLEAAVVNLESYEGNEVMLCAGYELLDALVNRKRNAYSLRRVHGILAFADEAEDTASGPATPSLA